MSSREYGNKESVDQTSNSAAGVSINEELANQSENYYMKNATMISAIAQKNQSTVSQVANSASITH